MVFWLGIRSSEDSIWRRWFILQDPSFSARASLVDTMDESSKSIDDVCSLPAFWYLAKKSRRSMKVHGWWLSVRARQRSATHNNTRIARSSGWSFTSAMIICDQRGDDRPICPYPSDFWERILITVRVSTFSFDFFVTQFPIRTIEIHDNHEVHFLHRLRRCCLGCIR